MTNEIQKRLTAAAELEASGDLLEAIKAYRDVYAIDSHCQDAILGLAKVALYLGKIEYAFDFFVKLLIENHENAWGYWGRAAVYFEYNQADRALREIAHAIELDSPPTSLRIECAALLNDNGYFNEAKSALSALTDDEFDEDAQIEWALSTIKLNLNDERTTSLLADHTDEDCDPIWTLLRGLALNNNAQNSGDALIKLAISQDPDLETKL